MPYVTTAGLVPAPLHYRICESVTELRCVSSIPFIFGAGIGVEDALEVVLELAAKVVVMGRHHVLLLRVSTSFDATTNISLSKSRLTKLEK